MLIPTTAVNTLTSPLQPGLNLVFALGFVSFLILNEFNFFKKDIKGRLLVSNFKSECKYV